MSDVSTVIGWCDAASRRRDGHAGAHSRRRLQPHTLAHRDADGTRCVLGSVDDGRAYLVVNLDKSLVDQGADATVIVREPAKKIGGGGGGRPNLAEAGGKNPEGLPEAYEIAKSEIASAIG